MMLGQQQQFYLYFILFIIYYCRNFLKNKLLNNLILFKEIQKKIFYKIFDEDYMILKTQTYNHKLGLIKNDEIKLLGEDRIVNYFWNWYKKSEEKDNPWKYKNKNQEGNVYEQIIFKYPPEIKKLFYLFIILIKLLLLYIWPKNLSYDAWLATTILFIFYIIHYLLLQKFS